MNIKTTRDVQTLLPTRSGTLRRAIYACIVNSLHQEGVAPSVREISRSVGIASLGHIEYHLTWLEQRGFIRRQSGTCRGIQLPTHAAGYPVLGRVVGGVPRSFLCVVEENLLQTGVIYALLVDDRTLLEEHICPGDALLVRAQAMSQQGELTLALHRQDAGQRCAALKRFSPCEGTERCEETESQGGRQGRDSHCQNWLRMETGRQREWQVQGVVIGVARLY